MRAKEGSLGHFRTTRSLANIGTRLHWSLVSRKDIDGLRMTILSEMLAINMHAAEHPATVSYLPPRPPGGGKGAHKLRSTAPKSSGSRPRSTTVRASSPLLSRDTQALSCDRRLPFSPLLRQHQKPSPISTHSQPPKRRSSLKKPKQFAWGWKR